MPKPNAQIGHGTPRPYKIYFQEYSQPAPAGLREGIEAVLIALAAQQSARENKIVDASELRRQVFEA